MECRKGFIYTWWDDSCLTQKLQTDFSLTAAEIPYQTLFDYVKNHENEIVPYLQQIDYGRKIDAFWKLQSATFFDAEKDFINSLDEAPPRFPGKGYKGFSCAERIRCIRSSF
jgi:hypothetical protein